MLVATGCSGKKRQFVSGGELGELLPRQGDGGPGDLDDREVPRDVEMPPGSDAGQVEGCADALCCDGESSSCIERCPGCQIDGECLAAGQLSPVGPCQICDPSRDAQGWSSNDSSVCDDGLFCTVDDVCVGGSCSGSMRRCDDGVDCNGISQCDESADRCSEFANQCESGALCDAASGACVTTCAGCIVSGVCLEDGAEQPGNSCMTCDVSRSVTSYSPAIGKPCGAEATECSQQDTCDDSGVCQANHAQPGTGCGNSASTECDGADSCDGNGNCGANRAGNGSACDDGRFCTVSDACQGGRLCRDHPTRLRQPAGV